MGCEAQACLLPESLPAPPACPALPGWTHRCHWHCTMQAAWPGTAPSAAEHETERQLGSAHSLADAVLSGLPAHDEAVAVARVAAASGRSIQEVAAWGRQQAAACDYAATGQRVAARGRIQASGGQVGGWRTCTGWHNKLHSQNCPTSTRPRCHAGALPFFYRRSLCTPRRPAGPTLQIWRGSWPGLQSGASGR